VPVIIGSSHLNVFHLSVKSLQTLGQAISLIYQLYSLIYISYGPSFFDIGCLYISNSHDMFIWQILHSGKDTQKNFLSFRLFIYFDLWLLIIILWFLQWKLIFISMIFLLCILVQWIFTYFTSTVYFTV